LLCCSRLRWGGCCTGDETEGRPNLIAGQRESPLWRGRDHNGRDLPSKFRRDILSRSWNCGRWWLIRVRFCSTSVYRLHAVLPQQFGQGTSTPQSSLSRFQALVDDMPRFVCASDGTRGAAESLKLAKKRGPTKGTGFGVQDLTVQGSGRRVFGLGIAGWAALDSKFFRRHDLVTRQPYGISREMKN
jgi:hypothetical protein